MNDIGFEFDAVALPPASGTADWASAAGIDGSLEARGRDPETDPGAGASRDWRPAEPGPLRPWWAPGNAPGAWAA